MKKTIAIIGTVLMLMPPLCYGQGISEDKYQHAGASAVVEWYMINNKPFNKWAPWQRVLANVALIGAPKELWDKRHSGHSCEWVDLAADGVGAIAMEGLVQIVHIEF